MRHGLNTFIALAFVMAFFGCSDLTTKQKGAAIGDWAEPLLEV